MAGMVLQVMVGKIDWELGMPMTDEEFQVLVVEIDQELSMRWPADAPADGQQDRPGAQHADDQCEAP